MVLPLRMRTSAIAMALLVRKARAQNEGANAAADEANCYEREG